MKFIQKHKYIILTSATILLTGLILLIMGRNLICECGNIKLWHGEVVSSENSQHLTDWYTFTHIIHGFILFGFFYLINKFSKKVKIPIGAAILISTILEAAWEIFENTDFIINRYREATISLDYYGDSIVNSFGDILAMLFGFYLAYKLPLWASLALILIIEIALAYFINDNLALNVIMLIYPLQAIRNWQGGNIV